MVTAAAQVSRPRRWAGLAAWGLWALAMLGLAGAACLDRLLRQAGRPDLAQFNADGVPALLAAVSADTVGALVASRRPRHPVGWLLLALGVTESVEIVADGYGSYGLQARPGPARCRPPAWWRCTTRPPSPSGRPASASCCC